jgi:DNA-binding GntR family transcriptional regulator
VTSALQESEVDRVYRLLKGWLIECRLAPGEFLSEVELAHLCQTSRTPVREATNRLGQDGWLSRIRHKGYLVTPVSLTTLLQLYEYRKILECFAAEKAAQVATAEQLDRLAALVAVESDPGVGIAACLAVSDPFHLEVSAIAGNQWVVTELTRTLEFVHRLDKLSACRDGTFLSHPEIVRALRARNPREARLAMAAHIDNSRERMLRLFAA